MDADDDRSITLAEFTKYLAGNIHHLASASASAGQAGGNGAAAVEGGQAAIGGAPSRQ